MFRNDLETHQTAMVWKQNCIMCGRVSSAAICEDCIEEARIQFEELIQYLNENPKSTMIELYGNSKIPFKMIKAFLELGWINLILEDEETRLKTAEVMKAAKKSKT